MVDAHIKLAEVSACVQVIHVSQKLRLQSCCFFKKKIFIYVFSTSGCDIIERDIPTMVISGVQPQLWEQQSHPPAV